ncbi:hypothetical protein [Gloeocapsa sp. PCC 73106]|uniref:hypothetical protein n=1 Tax=Gloeocapsa sp. PCC 73106 TaxID=102232 RepID=UPI0002AD06E4|nr:hypothetical protein [Gloeocapsa sp. PCC 73106]ELR97283.1 hypothetical protein GLO73106DRAFT_00010910 [Gloeocapsa sp. PCC 73106]
MRIILHTRAIINNGQLKATIPSEIKDGEIDVILISQDEGDDFETMRQMAKDQGYDSREKILELIHKVKLEMLQEKERVNE